jgi:hypothetical protein
VKNLSEKRLSEEIVYCGNGRFLYMESEVFPLDWQSTLAEIAQWIDSSEQLELASHDSGIYFFLASKEEDFSLEACWVGIDVLGNIVEDMLPDELFYFDYFKGPILKIPLTSSLGDLDFNAVCSQEESARREMERQGIKLNDSWKLCFEKNKNEVQFYLQFFVEVA